MRELLEKVPVVPVVVIDDAADALAGYAAELEKLVDEMRERTRRHNLLVRQPVPALASDPDAPVLPLALAEEVPALELDPLHDAVAGLARSAERYAKALTAFRASAAAPTDAELARLNQILRQSELQGRLVQVRSSNSGVTR